MTSIRDKVLGSSSMFNKKVVTIDFDEGPEQVEFRRATFEVRRKIYDATAWEDKENQIYNLDDLTLNILLNCVYEPDTDTPVFDQKDKEWFNKNLTGHEKWFGQMVKEAFDFCIKQPGADKTGKDDEETAEAKK